MLFKTSYLYKWEIRSQGNAVKKQRDRDNILDLLLLNLSCLPPPTYICTWVWEPKTSTVCLLLSSSFFETRSHPKSGAPQSSQPGWPPSLEDTPILSPPLQFRDFKSLLLYPALYMVLEIQITQGLTVGWTHLLRASNPVPLNEMLMTDAKMFEATINECLVTCQSLSTNLQTNGAYFSKCITCENHHLPKGVGSVGA